VQALFRRIDAIAGVTAPKVLQLEDDIEIDVDARRVRQHGEVVHLTPTEFDLLVSLAERPGRVLTRERLLADVWGYRDGSGARTVDSHVRALRRKLGDGVVRTVHGVGYGLGEAGSATDADELPAGPGAG
jgi:DNA-binding response OmpR family regulator